MTKNWRKNYGDMQKMKLKYNLGYKKKLHLVIILININLIELLFIIFNYIDIVNVRMKLNWVTVFCGSSNGTEAIYGETAIELGKILVTENIGLIYGGATVGLMGSVADSVI